MSGSGKGAAVDQYATWGRNMLSSRNVAATIPDNCYEMLPQPAGIL